MLGELIDLISGIPLEDENGKARDLLGRVYEYFLSGFAGSEGKRRGAFYAPGSVVRVLVDMLERSRSKRKIEGRVYDPCCGSGGMFVQAERLFKPMAAVWTMSPFMGRKATTRHGGLQDEPRGTRNRRRYIRWNNEGSFHKVKSSRVRHDPML